jgi:hypothetical protein
MGSRRLLADCFRCGGKRRKIPQKVFSPIFFGMSRPTKSAGASLHMSYIDFFSQAQVEFSEVGSRDRLGEVSKKNQLEKGK